MHSPFKRLEAYQKQDKDRFFGRDKETAQLFNAVRASNLILLYGASGTGKTSLIKCGLENQFQKSDWLPIYIRRGDDLNDSLLRELDRELDQETDARQSVEEKIQALYWKQYRTIYLIFDQFEELYIMGTRDEKRSFHRTIAKLLKAGLTCKILISMREEYIAYLSEFERFIPSLFDNRVRIEKMNDRSLSRVIIGTLKWGNIDLVHPQVTVMNILENLRNKREGIDLTNLQVYLDRLWQKAKQKQEAEAPIIFDPDLVKEVGAMGNVLSKVLDEYMAEVEEGLRQQGVDNPKGKPLEILYTLVTDDGTKRSLNVSDMLDRLPPSLELEKAHIEYCLKAFYERQLIHRFAEGE